MHQRGFLLSYVHYLTNMATTFIPFFDIWPKRMNAQGPSFYKALTHSLYEGGGSSFKLALSILIELSLLFVTFE